MAVAMRGQPEGGGRMRAICKTCGRTVYWRATRGSRLKDHRCECGGELRAYRDYSGARKPRGKPITCAVCGRKRFRHFKRYDREIVVREEGRFVTVPAMAPICWHHGVVVPDGQGGWRHDFDIRPVPAGTPVPGEEAG